jgi:hypothetical protein
MGLADEIQGTLKKRWEDARAGWERSDKDDVAVNELFGELFVALNSAILKIAREVDALRDARGGEDRP